MQAVLEAAEKHEGVIRVEEVHLSIGKLTFVGEEQLRFCWEAVTEERELLKGSRLMITEEEVNVRCTGCGYVGDLEVKEDPLYHYMLPTFACPRCGKRVEIESGRGIMVRNVKLMIEGPEEEGNG